VAGQRGAVSVGLEALRSRPPPAPLSGGLAGLIEVVLGQLLQRPVDRFGAGAAALELGSQAVAAFRAAVLAVGDEGGGGRGVVEEALAREAVQGRFDLVFGKVAPDELELQLAAEVRPGSEELHGLLIGAAQLFSNSKGDSVIRSLPPPRSSDSSI
jgi:hypothetical protein